MRVRVCLNRTRVSGSRGAAEQSERLRFATWGSLEGIARMQWQAHHQCHITQREGVAWLQN